MVAELRNKNGQRWNNYHHWVEAQGIADYERIINIGLTNQQLQYEQIKAYLEIAKSPNAKVIVMGKGNTPVILDAKN